MYQSEPHYSQSRFLPTNNLAENGGDQVGPMSNRFSLGWRSWISVAVALTLSTGLPAQQFGGKEIIESSAFGAQSVFAIDLDGDGDADVLSASGRDNKIAWYENQGGGNFGQQQIISDFADHPWSVYATDLDGDGDADVLSASLDDDKIAWYENQGGGTFGRQQIITTAAEAALSVYATDLDGDGDADVLSASQDDDKIAWYENHGGGNFGQQQIISTTARGASSVYAADLDGDGDADVLSASWSNNAISLYENQGGGNFGHRRTITQNAVGAASVYAIDLDEDGDADVLSASASDNKIAWYENQGDGNFGQQQQIITTSASGAFSVYATDLDGDGDVDVLSASAADDDIAWYENLNSNDLDEDDDGLIDSEELSLFGTDPMKFDTDADGLGDGMELGVTVGTPDTDPAVFIPDADPNSTTNPLLADTDAGGVSDGIEDQNQDGGVDTWETDPNLGADEALAFYVRDLRPGQRVRLEIYNAAPIEFVMTAYSLRGPGPIATTLGITVDLTRPITVLSASISDQEGRVSALGPRVPAGVALGLPVWFQALEFPLNSTLPPRKSNSILLPIGAF